MPPIEVPHPNTGAAASPAEIYEWVGGHVPSSAQAVPVLTATHREPGVLVYALRAAGSEVTVDDCGWLFSMPRR
jgi:hypothetical protein